MGSDGEVVLDLTGRDVEVCLEMPTCVVSRLSCVNTEIFSVNVVVLVLCGLVGISVVDIVVVCVVDLSC